MSTLVQAERGRTATVLVVLGALLLSIAAVTLVSQRPAEAGPDFDTWWPTYCDDTGGDWGLFDARSGGGTSVFTESTSPATPWELIDSNGDIVDANDVVVVTVAADQLTGTVDFVALGYRVEVWVSVGEPVSGITQSENLGPVLPLTGPTGGQPLSVHPSGDDILYVKVCYWEDPFQVCSLATFQLTQVTWSTFDGTIHTFNEAQCRSGSSTTEVTSTTEETTTTTEGATTTSVAGPDEPELPDTGGGALLALVGTGAGLMVIGTSSLVLARNRRKDSDIS